MGEYIGERRKDIERTSLMSTEEGYDDAYVEDEEYGFKECTTNTEIKAGQYIHANKSFSTILNRVYQHAEFDTPIFSLSENVYYTVTHVHGREGTWIHATFRVNENKSITGYIHESLFVVNILNEVEVLSSRSFNGTTAVKTEDGANFYNKPQGEVIETLPFNTVVYVLDVDDTDWAKVDYQQKIGYINVKRLSTETPMPGSLAKLHMVKKGESVEKLIKEYYNLSKEDDRRYYANVLLYLNNPGNIGTRGIYVEDAFDLLESLTIDYDRIKLREDYLIWIPDKAYADSLMHLVNSGSYKKEFGKKIDKLTKGIRETVDELWPVGFGAYYGISVGATFGIPIGADAQIETYFYRKDKNTIGLKKYDKVAAGLDTGVSAGFYIGGKNTKKGDAVLGAHAGANAEAKIAGLSYAEFEFPINDGDAILSALMAITNQSEKFITKAIVTFLDIIGDTQLSPHHYLKKTKAAISLELQGNLGGSLGAKKASSDKSREAYKEKGSHASEKAADNYGGSILEAVNPFKKDKKIKHLVAAQLNVGADVLLAANLKFGVEFENELKMEDGKSQVKSTEMAVFIEAGAQAAGNISIPFLVNLGLAPDRTIGVKLVWKGDFEKDNSFSFQGVKLYTTSGEMDYYAGGASETEIKVGDSVGKSVEAIKNLGPASFKSLIKQVKYKKRIELVNFLSNSLSGVIKQKQKDAKATIKHSLRQDYLQISGYLDVEVDFSKVSDKAIDAITEIITSSFTGKTMSEKFLNGLQSIFDFIKGDLESVKTKYDGDDTVDLFKKLRNLFTKEMLPTAILHVRAGAGLAGGFHAAKGGKIKLYGDISGGILVEYDVQEELINLIEDAGVFIINYAQSKLTEEQQAQLEQHVIKNSKLLK